jgi:hypothetical protein
MKKPRILEELTVSVTRRRYLVAPSEPPPAVIDVEGAELPRSQPKAVLAGCGATVLPFPGRRAS